MKAMAALECVLAISGLYGSAVFSQVQSWPPGGTSPSPITAAIKLPVNRYVPSTKRYNLVWADELLGLPAGKTRFVAQNYAASQKMTALQVAEYRAYNSNFLCVIYHLSNGINPHNDNDCPLPHGTGAITSCTPSGWVSEWDDYFTPWLASAGIAKGDTRFERMFQHYAVVDSSHRVWHSDPQWTMCLEDTDWQKYVTDATINWITGEQDDGCFFDVCVETMVGGLYHPAAGDPAPHNFNWYLSPYGPAGYTVASLADFSVWMNAQYLGYWQSIYKRYHTASADYLILPNVDQMITGWYDPAWMEGNAGGETIDGAMMENLGNATGSDMYLTLSRAVKHLTGKGKILIAQFYDSTQTERYRRTAMYMLVKNQNSFINILAPGAPGWFPEYEIDLGDQGRLPSTLDSLRVSGSGSASLFRRDYQNGMILCNTSGSATNYALAGTTWSVVNTSGGGSVADNGSIAQQSITFVPVSSQVLVPPSGCIILKNSAAAIRSRLQNSADDPALFSGPVNGWIKVNRRGSIAIYNISGVLQFRKRIENESTRFSVLGLAKGVYVFDFIGAGYKKITKIRI